MTSKKFNVNDLRVASPCRISWDQMTGDDRTRHCSLCELNVHNVAGLSTVEVENLVATSESRLCVRLFRRSDGTVITRDCPVGLRKYRKRVASIASAAFASVLGFLSVSYAQKDKDVTKVDASEIRIVRTVEKFGRSSIRGTLLDPNGAVIPNVEMQLLQHGKRVRPIVKSDADGGFAFEGLSVGFYEIRVSATGGFRALRVDNIELKADEKLEMSLELPIDGSIEHLMGVVGEAPMIDITTNEQTTVFTRDMIDRIPGRRPFD